MRRCCRWVRRGWQARPGATMLPSHVLPWHVDCTVQTSATALPSSAGLPGANAWHFLGSGGHVLTANSRPGCARAPRGFAPAVPHAGLSKHRARSTALGFLQATSSSWLMRGLLSVAGVEPFAGVAITSLTVSEKPKMMLCVLGHHLLASTLITPHMRANTQLTCYTRNELPWG